MMTTTTTFTSLLFSSRRGRGNWYDGLDGGHGRRHIVHRREMKEAGYGHAEHQANDHSG
jgi:hypothetical protein